MVDRRCFALTRLPLPCFLVLIYGAHLMARFGVAILRCRMSTQAPALVTIAAVALLSRLGGAHAQELEPRAYSAAPVGTNFLLGGYARTTGDVSLVPSIPITDVRASVNAGLLGYSRTFDVAGRTASAGFVLPYVSADLSGNVGEQGRKISRSGLGDLALRLTANLYGNPAVTPAEFARREPTTTIGTALTIIAPTGDYNSQHLINISAHRWAFKPEIGFEHPIGNWFVNGAAGLWLFTDNNNFFGGNVRGQDPLLNLELDAGYLFRPGLWLAASATWYSGGETTVNGVANHDSLANSRYGITLSLPLAPPGLSAKFSWASWLSGHLGGHFEVIGIALQYRWFDR